jgi:hypothetical protein
MNGMVTLFLIGATSYEGSNEPTRQVFASPDYYVSVKRGGLMLITKQMILKEYEGVDGGGELFLKGMSFGKDACMEAFGIQEAVDKFLSDYGNQATNLKRIPLSDVDISHATTRQNATFFPYYPYFIDLLKRPDQNIT